MNHHRTSRGRSTWWSATLLCALSLASAWACAAPGAHAVASEPPPCQLEAAAELIAVADPIEGERNEVFDFPDSPAWWAPAGWDEPRTQYRAALVERLEGEPGLRPRALLERQRAVYAAFEGDGAREVENVDALLRGRAGAITPASCLEWRLFDRQARRFPMVEHPTEFGAYVLRGHGRVRVYLSGADLVGGKLRREVQERVRADVAAGFAPVAHLHNHPFLFDRRPGDRMWTSEATVGDVAGALAPSLTDVQAWRRMAQDFGLQGGWVTNGLETARYTQEDFHQLSAWP